MGTRNGDTAPALFKPSVWCSEDTFGAFASVFQLVEKVDLESIQCRFESYQGHFGVLAQLVEQSLCKAKVRGSSPLDSTFTAVPVRKLAQ